VYEKKLQKKFDLDYFNITKLIEEMDENELIKFYVLLLTAFVRSGKKDTFLKPIKDDQEMVSSISTLVDLGEGIVDGWEECHTGSGNFESGRGGNERRESDERLL
jgi:hypothetical protein